MEKLPSWLVAQLAALALTGCGSETGLLILTRYPVDDDPAKKIQQLQYHVAYNEGTQWIREAAGPHTKPYAVADRDLSANPYKLLITPIAGWFNPDLGTFSHSIVVEVAGLNAAGNVTAFGSTSELKFQENAVVRVDLTLTSIAPRPATSFNDNGCFCSADGQPRLGTSGQPCHVSTSPPECDGYHSEFESNGRDLPCFVDKGLGCQVGIRRCWDQNGVAYEGSCNPVIIKPVANDVCTHYVERACRDPLVGFRDALVPQDYPLTPARCIPTQEEILFALKDYPVVALLNGSDTPSTKASVKLRSTDGVEDVVMERPAFLKIKPNGTPPNRPVLVDLWVYKLLSSPIRYQLRFTFCDAPPGGDMSMPTDGGLDARPTPIDSFVRDAQLANQHDQRAEGDLTRVEDLLVPPPPDLAVAVDLRIPDLSSLSIDDAVSALPVTDLIPN